MRAVYVAALGGVALAQHPWGQFGKTAAHAWRGGSPGPLTMPTMSWRAQSNLTRPCSDDGSLRGTCSDYVYGSAAASSDGRVFFVSYAGCLFAFNAASGSPLLPPCTSDPRPQMLSSPALSDDGSTVYVGDRSGVVTAWASSDARVVWTYPTGGEIRGSVAVGEDARVFVASSDGCLYAIHRNGSLAWRSASTGSLIESTPALWQGSSPEEGKVFVSGDGVLFAFSLNSGLSLWNASFTSARGNPPEFWEVLSSPSLSDDGSTVFVGSWDGAVSAFAADSGKPLWRFSTVLPPLSLASSTRVVTTPAVTTGGLIIAATQHVDPAVAATNGTLFALVATTGTLAWATPVSCAVFTAAVIGNGDVLFISVYGGDGIGNGGVAAYRTTTGDFVWRLSVGEGVWAAPIMDAGGSLFIGTINGAMLALAPPSPGPSALPTPSPTSAAPGFAPGLAPSAIEALAACGGVVLGLLALAAVALTYRARCAAKINPDETYSKLESMQSIQ